MVSDKELQNFLPLEEYFRLGLYMFDIGQNDLDYAFYLNSEDQVLFRIPTIVEEFETGIKVSSRLLFACMIASISKNQSYQYTQITSFRVIFFHFRNSIIKGQGIFGSTTLVHLGAYLE